MVQQRLLGTIVCVTVLLMSAVVTQAQEKTLVERVVHLLTKYQTAKLISHWTHPCVGTTTRMSDQCVNNLKLLPAALEEYFSPNPTVVQSGFATNFCSACSEADLMSMMDELQSQMLTGAQQESRGAFSLITSSDTDPSCDGTVGTVSNANLRDIIQVMLRLLCSQNEEGEYCWEPEIVPAAIQNSGMYDILLNYQTGTTLISALTSPFNPANAPYLQKLGDVEGMCSAMSSGGCCSRIYTDSMKQLAALNCMSGPVIEGFFDQLTNCDRMEATCPGFSPVVFQVDPSSRVCPGVGFWSTILEWSELKDPQTSKFAACQLELNRCPEDKCELLRCFASLPEMSGPAPDDGA